GACRGGDGEGDAEVAPAFRGEDVAGAAVELRDLADDGEAQARAGDRVPGVGGAIEAGEDPLVLLDGDARPGIRDVDVEVGAAVAEDDPDVRARMAELDRVAHQVGDGALDLLAVHE